MTRPSPQTCILLAGGLGTRLRSAVAELPKCLAPVGSRSFLDVQLASLFAAGIDDVVLSLGYKAEAVIASVAVSQAGRPVRHVVEQSLLGTGGAIAYAMDSLGLDEVLVANGDTYLEGNLAAMLAPLDRAGGELFRMAVVTVANRYRFGGVQIDGEGRIERFLEKGQQGAGEINAGLYRLCRAALPAAHPGAYSLEAETLPGLVALSAVTAQPVDGSFIDIGVPDDYFRFCAEHAARSTAGRVH